MKVKVKTLRIGIGAMNRPLGEIIEVSKEEAEYMVKHGQAELVEEEDKKEEKKSKKK